MPINRLYTFLLLQLIPIFSLLSLANAFLAQKLSSQYSSHLLNSSAPSYINLHHPLHFDSCTFFTKVNLPPAENDDESDDESDHQDFVTMALSLDSPTSFLVSPSAEGCEGFLPYYCKNGTQCTFTETRGALDLPFVQVEGVLASTGIYFDKQNPDNPKVDLLYVDKCTNNLLESVSPESYGIIGLGISGENKEHFSFISSFSIYIHSNGYDGELIFGLDPNKVHNFDDAKVFQTTAKWEIPMDTMISLQTDNSTKDIITNFDGTISFDMNACFIGFPKSLLSETITSLAEYGLKCDRGNTTPPYKCTFSGNQTNLPVIILRPLDDDLDGINMVNLESKVYLNKTANNTYTLMIVPVDDAKLENSFLVNEKYRNNIILGIPYLRHHYVHFESEGNENQIAIYKLNISDTEDKDEGSGGSAYALYIFLGITLVVIILSVWIFGNCCKRPERTRRSPRIAQPLMTEEPVQFLEVSRPGKVTRPSLFKKESEAKSFVV